MSQKQDKKDRKNATEANQQAMEVAFSMIVNVHKNGDISVGGNIPKDPNATVSILATAIATQFSINALMEENQSRILKPNMMMPPPPVQGGGYTLEDEKMDSKRSGRICGFS